MVLGALGSDFTSDSQGFHVTSDYQALKMLKAVCSWGFSSTNSNKHGTLVASD